MLIVKQGAQRIPGAVLAWTFAELQRHPETYRRLRAEVRHSKVVEKRR